MIWGNQSVLYFRVDCRLLLRVSINLAKILSRFEFVPRKMATLTTVYLKGTKKSCTQIRPKIWLYYNYRQLQTKSFWYWSQVIGLVTAQQQPRFKHPKNVQWENRNFFPGRIFSDFHLDGDCEDCAQDFAGVRSSEDFQQVRIPTDAGLHALPQPLPLEICVGRKFGTNFIFCICWWPFLRVSRNSIKTISSFKHGANSVLFFVRFKQILHQKIRLQIQIVGVEAKYVNKMPTTSYGPQNG